MWAYAVLWPIAAIALLASIFFDEQISTLGLAGSVIGVLVGTGLNAVIDSWLLSSEPWWKIAQL
jgi:hypothetical protein